MENIPGKIIRMPPVTKFLVAATLVVSLPTMLGIIPAISVVFDSHRAFFRKEVWRIFTTWFYSPSSEFFLFLAGIFLLYHSAINLETNLFGGHSADYAWQVILSSAIIMCLNIPLKTAMLSRPLLHFLIYRDSYSVKNPYISVLDLAYIPRRYLPWVMLALDAIMGGPLTFCRSLTGVLVAHIWFMLIPRPSVLQTAESKTADDQPKKPLPGWQKYAGAPGWVRKVIPNERGTRGDEDRGTRPGGNVRTIHADSGAESLTVVSDFAISDGENDVDDKFEPTPQCQQLEPPQDETSILPNPLINQLPTEILLRIFEFTHYLWRSTSTKKEREDSPAVWDRSIQNLMRLPYPDALSHVCTFWRELSLAYPPLWSQLELYTLGRSPQTFLNRCSTFLPRAQNRELQLIVRFRHCEQEPISDCDAMKAFCVSVSPRLRSFYIDNHALNDTAFASSIIQATLPHTTPGTLARLYIKDYGVRSIPNHDNNDDGLVGWRLPTAEDFGISQDVLDSIVRPIRFLQLRGQFFPWNSPAYHGLTELQLLCTRPKHGHRPLIKVSRLRKILLACPELRVFHININISNQVTSETLTTVPLNSLEELSLRGLSRNCYDILLPLLAPGQGALQFTFQTQHEAAAPLYCPTILSFLRRTNVTSLYILGRSTIDQSLDIEQLLTESPINLHTLGLERLGISEMEPTQIDRLKALPPIRLNRLYLRKCAIDINTFKKLAEFLPAQILKLHRPDFKGIPNEDEAQVRQETATIFPTVKWVRSSRDMELWNAWEVEYID
ncbi:unnamed protein product [Rhizoctonia solani]|uniref:Derlin n=1 Tax=Rhizoctonia solani TaxID=456999 RepID=A0A8H3DQI1_9AGAM|nr:unnamed protein product [Rhizoctonia solani]